MRFGDFGTGCVTVMIVLFLNALFYGGMATLIFYIAKVIFGF